MKPRTLGGPDFLTRPFSIRYVFAIAVTLLALLLQMVLDSYLDVIQFLVVYPAVFVVAWFAGFWPAALSIIFCSVGVTYFFIEPKQRFFPDDFNSGLNIIVFYLLSFLLIKLVDLNQKASGRLRKMLNEREEFISITSHELKTPLTSLKLHTQLLQRKIEKEVNEQEKGQLFRKYNEETQKYIHRLVRLVDDMLDISRIRSGKLSFSKAPTDLCLLVKEVVERYKKELNGAGPDIQFYYQGMAFGSWDIFRIEQVISNLINNAIRYGLKRTIYVRAKAGKENVLISVCDQGIGISSEDQERIFDRYERANISERSGLGLGLFIAKEIIKAHGGKIWVESELDKGSCFYVELPLKARD